MRTFYWQGPGGDALGRLRQSVWRYRWLVVVAVLVGALLGYGWAARQPALYEGVSRVRMVHRCPPIALCVRLGDLAQGFLRSPGVLQRAVRLSGSRVSAKTLGQGLEVDVAQVEVAADRPEMVLITIRVVDATAKGAAQLANAVALASQQLMAEQESASARRRVADLERRQRQLDALDHQLAADPGNARLQANRDAMAQQLDSFANLLGALDAFRGQVWQEQAAVPQEPVLPRPLRAAAIGGLLGLVVGAGLAWWRSRPSRTLTMAAAGGR
jgi:LPS O-antigen subunit length determinant protein (WzzB/FepE family)